MNTNELFEQIKNYVPHLISNHYSTFLGTEHFEDLLQEGYLALWECLPGYNSSKGALTTYVKPYILHGVSAYIMTNIYHTTRYYYRMKKRIVSVLEEADNNGERLTREDLVSRTGLSLKQIAKAMIEPEACVANLAAYC